MNKIREQIYLGSWQPARDLVMLKQHGITAVLNVALDQEDPDFFGEGITNVKVGLGDCDYNKPIAKEIAVLMLEKLVEAGEIVFVHCVSGVSRSPYVIGKYLAKKENRTLSECIVEIQKIRPPVFNPNPLQDE